LIWLGGFDENKFIVNIYHTIIDSTWFISWTLALSFYLYSIFILKGRCLAFIFIPGPIINFRYTYHFCFLIRNLFSLICSCHFHKMFLRNFSTISRLHIQLCFYKIKCFIYIKVLVFIIRIFLKFLCRKFKYFILLYLFSITIKKIPTS